MHRRLFAAAVAFGLGTLVASPAGARKPEDVFAGKILMSDKAFPTQAKSVNAYIGALKKQAKDRFWEDKEKKQWLLYYSAFFKKPLNDLEVTLKTYDISSGEKRMVESYELYLDSRGQRAFSGRLKMPKGEGGYDPNAKILIVMENRGVTLAQTVFYIQGEGKRYSGKVEFSEEEANGGEQQAPPPKK